MSSDTTRGAGRRVARLLVPGLGVAGLLALAPFFLASGLLAPLWAVVGLLVVWVAALLLAVRWFRRRPYLVLALPLVAAGLWWGAISLGEALLGWTG